MFQNKCCGCQIRFLVFSMVEAIVVSGIVAEAIVVSAKVVAFSVGLTDDIWLVICVSSIIKLILKIPQILTILETILETIYFC